MTPLTLRIGVTGLSSFLLANSRSTPAVVRFGRLRVNRHRELVARRSSMSSRWYRSAFWLPLTTLLAITAMPLAADDAALANKEPRTRTFQFTYAATVTDLKPGEAARVWLPAAQTTDEQEVTVISAPKEAKLHHEKKHGNAMYYLDAKADADGKIALETVFLVKRRELRGEQKLTAEEKAKLADYLKPDSRVPIDGKPLDLIKGKTLPDDQIAMARVLYDIVNSHMPTAKPERIGARRFGLGLRKWLRQLHRFPQPVHLAGKVEENPG